MLTCMTLEDVGMQIYDFKGFNIYNGRLNALLESASVIYGHEILTTVFCMLEYDPNIRPTAD
jgi:hypothetical protein